MVTNLYDKVYGCLCGGLIGDAMGAPVEGMHYSKIEEDYGWIDTFQGAGTDDSAIKQILCQAILENGGYVTADEWAASFLKNKDKYYPLFFVPVKNMFHKLESKLSLPVYAGVGNMHSSSSAMSISPMGLINACDPRQAALETYDVAGLVHAGDSTFCRDGACCMAAAIAEAISPKATVQSIIDASTKYLHTTSSWEFLNAVEKMMEIAKRTGDYKAFRKEFYESCLEDIICDSRETVPCVLALFYLSNGEARTAITYAANIGRDSDTIGTMIGALCGAFKGASGLPADWLSQLEEGYGKYQQVSKEDYGIDGVEVQNQRELASRLVEVIQNRRKDKEQVFSLLTELD